MLIGLHLGLHFNSLIKLKKENKMLEAKTDMYQSSKESEKKYEEVLKAFRDYSGKGDEDEYDVY